MIRLRLSLIVAIYLILGVAYSLSQPLGQAPDEVDHFLYSRFIIEHGRLPLTAEERATAGRKAYLPPFFHGLVAATTGWSYGPPILKFVPEASRYDLTRTLFHTDALINTEDELFPYRGMALTWHLSRVVSLLVGVAVILLTYRTTLEILPGRKRLATWAAAIIAFVPAFVFISASTSYESLVALTAGLHFWLLVKIARGDNRLRNFLLLGLVMGLSVTVKYVAIILPVQVVSVMAYLAWRYRQPWFGRVVMVGLTAMLASSWWFGFVMYNFNEVAEHGWVIGLLRPIIAGGTDTTQNHTAFILTGGEIGQSVSTNRPPFWQWVVRTFHTFWVEPVERSYALGVAAPLAAACICLLAAVGLVRLWQRQQRLWAILLVLHVIFFGVFPFVRYLVQGELSHTAQGRHLLFPIATIMPLLLIYGWQGWLSSRWQQRLALGTAAGLLTWNLAQLVLVATCCVAPLPVRTVMPEIDHRLDHPFGESITLLGYNLETTPQAVSLQLYWQSQSFPDQDYQLAVYLKQGEETRLAWQGFPANGRYATRIWEQREIVRDDLAFPLVDLPPGTYDLELQLLGDQRPLGSLRIEWIQIPTAAPFEPNLWLEVAGQRIGGRLWQGEPYQKLGRLEYQPRMNIALVWQGIEQPVNWWLVGPEGTAYPIQLASGHVGYFPVTPGWLPGAYRLRAEMAGDTAELPVPLTIFNKEPRQMTPPPIPNLLEANFAQRIKLLGYNLPHRVVAAGQAVPVILYWQGVQTMDRDYTFFAKLLDGEQRLKGTVERFARDGYKTSHWFEGEVVVDQFQVPVATDTPPGVYWINVGVYVGVNGNIVYLPLVKEGQPTDVTSVTFGPVKIGGPPEGVVVDQIAPQHPLSQDLGGVIRLRGYDLATDQLTLTLRLYWESLATATTGYTVFVHVLDQTGQTVAQMDQQPLGGIYPTQVWSPGELIPDTITVPLPQSLPPGPYQLRVGMYDLQTGARLAVPRSADDSILLAVMEP